MISIANTPNFHQRLRSVGLFTFATFLCLAMVAVRTWQTGSITFVFLVWNIFLAAIPYAISTVLVLTHDRVPKVLALLLGCAWLAFFPNAPYILTDLFHLKPRTGVPYWFDLVLILSFAGTGLMLGYASLLDIQHLVTKYVNRKAGWMFSMLALVLGAFGIYLGRYLRWNTWDLITTPQRLLADIADRIMNPLAHPQTYGVTIVFSFFLIVGYLILVHIGKLANAEESRHH